MPRYDYECPKCGIYEIEHSILEEARKKCAKCKSAIKRLISKTNFELKGHGWYASDYKDRFWT